jgi:hypothetical protein
MSLQDSSTKKIQLVSGSETTQFIYPNEFRLTLPTSGFRTIRDEVCMKSMTIYYSFFNVSVAKGNNTFSYVWPDGGKTYPVVLADGIWSFANIFTYFQNVMLKNGHYLVDPFGTNVFYLYLVVNPTLYCISFIATPLPSSLPASYTNPANVDLVQAAGLSPQLQASDGFSPMLGFAAGTYPALPAASATELNSGVPQITTATSFNLLCNLVDNTGFTLTPGVLHSFVIQPGTEPGSLVNKEPYLPDWVPVFSLQTFQTISIRLVDQLMRPITIQDPSGFVLTLNVRRRAQ